MPPVRHEKIKEGQALPNPLIELAGAEGFEPSTLGFGGSFLLQITKDHNE